MSGSVPRNSDSTKARNKKVCHWMAIGGAPQIWGTLCPHWCRPKSAILPNRPNFFRRLPAHFPGRRDVGVPGNRPVRVRAWSRDQSVLSESIDPPSHASLAISFPPTLFTALPGKPAAFQYGPTDKECWKVSPRDLNLVP